VELERDRGARLRYEHDQTVMKDAMPHSDDLGERLETDVKTILADTEELLKAAGTESSSPGELTRIAPASAQGYPP